MAISINLPILFSTVKAHMEANGESNIDTLLTAFAVSACGTFKPEYAKSGKWLTEFRGYQHTKCNSTPSGKYVWVAAWDGAPWVSYDYGITWINRSFGLPAENIDIWVSNSGQYVYVAVNGTRIFLSINYGATWAGVISDDAQWYALAGNEVGNTITIYATVGGSGEVYRSINQGTFSPVGSTSKDWFGIACSADNKFVTAVVANDNIYTLSGSTWTARSITKNWLDVAMSSDGKYQTAVSQDAEIYTSSNFGITWIFREDYTGNLISVDMSANGEFQYVVGDSNIKKSNNHGSTWTSHTTSINWKSVICNSLGDIVYLTAKNLSMYKSTDYLVNFALIIPTTPSEDWKGIATNKGDDTIPVSGTLSVGTILGDRMTLSWTAGTSINNVSNYQLYWKEDGGVYAAIDADKELSYIKTNLNLSTTYLFYVVAIDAFGNESTGSNVITQITAGSLLTVAPIDWNFAASSPSDKVFTVTASVGNSWNVTGLASWLGVTGGSGTGNGSFTIDCDDNVVQSPRSDTFQITSDAPTFNVDVDQDPAEPA